MFIVNNSVVSSIRRDCNFNQIIMNSTNLNQKQQDQQQRSSKQEALSRTILEKEHSIKFINTTCMPVSNCNSTIFGSNSCDNSMSFTWAGLDITMKFEEGDKSKMTTPETWPDIRTNYVPNLTIALLAILAVIVLCTIFGNLLVILAVLNYKPLKCAQNYLLVSLAIWDISVGLLVMPISSIDYLISPWLLGKIICNIYVTSDVFFCTASILNLCAIAIDRYLKLCLIKQFS